MKAMKWTFLWVMAAVLSGCSARSSQDPGAAGTGNGELQIYYFHFTKRCATCNAVENETRVALELFYGDQVKDGDIAFISLNLDQEDGKEMAEQLRVSGQTLLLVRGEEMVNLTNEGFINARTNSGKFHEILKSHIDKML